MKTTRCLLTVVMMVVLVESANAALITGLTIESADTGANTNMNPLDAITGTGLPSGTPALTGTHSTSWADNWWSDSATGQITIDLEGNYNLDTIHVWNYNEGSGGRGRGIKNAQIFVSSDADEANLVKLNTGGAGSHDNGSGNFLFPQSTATSDYTGFDLSLSGVLNASMLNGARLFRIKGIDTYGQTTNGLAEVQFGGTTGPAPPPPPPPPPVSAPDLLFHYTFDDGTATSSTGSNNGAVNGAIGSTTAKIGAQSLSLDGDDDWVENVDLGTRQEMSYSFWYNTPNAQSCCSTGGVLYTNGGWGSDSLHSSLNTNGSIWNEVHINNQQNSSAPTTALNTWNHMTAVFDNGQITYYVNGVRTPAQSLSGSDVRLDVSRIGAWNDDREYTGLLDDWTLWADPLDAGQAKAIFDLGDQLGYNQADALALFQVFDGTLDSVSIGGLTWYGADPLVETPLGLVDLGGGDYGLVLDGYGRGVSTLAAPVPEPSTFVLAALGLLGLGWYSRHRRRRSA